VVGALEASGRRPTVEQYRKAGLFRKAAETLEETGPWQRAGEMSEHEVGDVARATAAYLKGGAGVQAGRLLEAEGRREEALLAFSAVPAGAADAARLHLDAGRPNDAAAVFAQVPTTEIEKLDDEPTLTRVAAFLVDSGRNLEAVRLLQVVKRRGPAGGRAHLLLGRALHARQLPELAEQELRSALGMPLEPADRQQAEYRLACLLEEAGRGPEALPLFQAILERELSYADVQERYRRLKARGTAENARA
jgi:tetratricopeptide (TPR) repeat protein